MKLFKEIKVVYFYFVQHLSLSRLFNFQPILARQIDSLSSDDQIPLNILSRLSFTRPSAPLESRSGDDLVMTFISHSHDIFRTKIQNLQVNRTNN